MLFVILLLLLFVSLPSVSLTLGVSTITTTISPYCYAAHFAPPARGSYPSARLTSWASRWASRQPSFLFILLFHHHACIPSVSLTLWASRWTIHFLPLLHFIFFCLILLPESHAVSYRAFTYMHFILFYFIFSIMHEPHAVRYAHTCIFISSIILLFYYNVSCTHHVTHVDIYYFYFIIVHLLQHVPIIKECRYMLNIIHACMHIIY